MTAFFDQWQTDYDAAVGDGGKVTDVRAEMSAIGALLLIVTVREDGETVEYTPYYDSSPYHECTSEDPEGHCGENFTCDGCHYDIDDGDSWLDSMGGAVDWGDWNWGEPVEVRA